MRGLRLPPRNERPHGFEWDVFYGTGGYVSNVTAARVANLAFFWAVVALTWMLAGGRHDPWVACVAGAAGATLPPIVAHSGFATTDVAFVASALLVLAALRAFLRRPAPAPAAWLGACLGLAVATKFTTFVFLPPIVASVVAFHYRNAWRRWRTAVTSTSTIRCAATAAAVALVVVWGCYGFHVGRLSDLPTQFGPYGDMPTSGKLAHVRNWRIPAHEFVHGLLFLRAHTTAGHAAMLLGRYSLRGFPLFYPIVLLTKTPLPFVMLAGLGLWALGRHRSDPQWSWFAGLAFGALGVLLVALTSPINLGVRHVLVIYPLVSLAAASGLVRWAERPRRRVVVAGAAATCLAAQAVLLAGSVPNQLTYFNVLAGPNPGYVSSDSDFDWGQDILAMERYFRAHPVPLLYVQLNGSARLCRHDLPPLKALTGPATGWIAVSERVFQLNQGAIDQDPCAAPSGTGIIAPRGWLDWLKAREPAAIIGKTIRLYRIEAATTRRRP